MADAIVTDNDSKFEPEPVPDNIADTELNGLQPAEESTDSEPVEPVQEETSDDQPTNTPEKVDDVEEPDTNSEEPADKEPEQPEEKPAEDAEARRKFNSEQAALRVQQRQERQNYLNQERAKIREAEAEFEQASRTGELDDIQQLRRENEIIKAQQWVDTVERNQANIVNENMRAQQEIPLFNPAAPEYNPAIYQAAIDRFNQAYVVTDEDSGQVQGAYDRNGNQVSLLNYLQQEAAYMSQVVQTTQVQSQASAQKAEAKMRAKAVNPSNPGKVTSSGDELADLLDKIGDVPLV